MRDVVSRTRIRWAAIGAAVATTLGAGGIGMVRATSPADAVAFVPVAPCRILDTRPDSTVGAKTSPFGPGETVTIAAHGAPGNCTGVPATATGVSINVTSVDATELTFLTMWPADEERPLASSLNPSPGQPPTPNAVTAALSPTGQFSIYNYQGSVHVVVDLVGYYTDHDHDDRYYSEAEADARFAPSDALPRLETATEHVSCMGSGFFLASAPATAVYGTVTNTGRWFQNAGGSLFRLRCPVSPPDGARLVSATFEVSDTSPATNVESVRVERYELDGSPHHVATVESITTGAGTPGDVTVEVPIDQTDPSRTLVDTGTYTYALQVAMGPSDPGSNQYVAVYGATLAYEIDRWVAG